MKRKKRDLAQGVAVTGEGEKQQNCEASLKNVVIILHSFALIKNGMSSLSLSLSLSLSSALTAFWHFFLLLITCGATETELTYGYERYPPFALKYGYKGPGKYKHYMKINVDDHYQIHGSDEDRPPDNYTYADGVKYLPGGKVGVARAAKAAKNASNKINPESVEKSVAGEGSLT